MPFIKGQSGNKTGRPKGAGNKRQIDLRKWINQFIDTNKEQMQADWKALEPSQRIAMFEKLLKYSLPTLAATTITTDFDKLTDEQLDVVVRELLTSLN